MQPLRYQIWRWKAATNPRAIALPKSYSLDQGVELMGDFCNIDYDDVVGTLEEYGRVDAFNPHDDFYYSMLPKGEVWVKP